ncbi:MAG: hypothetical protein OZ932_12160, partial [Flavobacteriia bacterium]|nr:hypothetical protein [Flavobacteriia bacterium]
MRTTNILRHLAWGVLGLVTQRAFSQASQANNNGGATSFLGWNAGANQILEVRNDAVQPIDFWTSQSFRARINEKISYASLNSFLNIDASGFMLVTPDDGFLGQVPK